MSELDKIYEKYSEIPNYYEMFNINYLEKQDRIISKLERIEEESLSKHDAKTYENVREAYYYLIKYRDRYDKKLKQMGVKFPLTKKEKRLKLFKRVIIGGIIVGIGVGATAQVKNIKEQNLNSNVCVEYEIGQGDTLDELEDEYGLRDINFSYHEISGIQRQQAAKNAGQDIYGFAALEDVIIGRTTKDKAERLVSEKGARIISKEEALDSLKGSKDSLVGEFEKAIEGNSDFEFYVPTNEKTLG